MLVEKYIRISEDGTSQMVYVSSEPRRFMEEMITQYAETIPKVIKGVFELNGSPCVIIHGKGSTYAYTRLLKLKISSFYSMDKDDKILRPKFMAESTGEGMFPFFPAIWTVPESMSLIFAAKIYQSSDDLWESRPNDACYLVAIGADKHTYRLPISNLYETCCLCMGDFCGRATTIQGAFSLALNQLDKSDWNADLTDNDRLFQAGRLFRFVATDKDIESLPVEDNWETMCQRSVTAITTMIATSI